MAFVDTVLARIDDPTERELSAEVWHTGNILDAVNDGSREMTKWQADREYEAAKSALARYRASK